MKLLLVAAMLIGCGAQAPGAWSHEGEYSAAIMQSDGGVAPCYNNYGQVVGTLSGGVTMWQDTSRQGDPLGVVGDFDLCGGQITGPFLGHINADKTPELYIPLPFALLRIHDCAVGPSRLNCKISGGGLDNFGLELCRHGFCCDCAGKPQDGNPP